MKNTFKIYLTVLFLSTILLSISNRVESAELSDRAVLEKADAKEAIAIANNWKWSRPDVKSYVDAREVVFEFPDGTKKKIALPKDKMYVAIAPYVDKTHAWTRHVFSSCQGELIEKTTQVKAIDQDGKVLVDQSIKTLKNGFFELWLPRDRKINLRIAYSGKSAEGAIETFANSKTCITTFQLR